MDINKTDMFEKFFNGFQEKFIESLKAAGEEKILVRILENQKASKEEYRTYFNCAWEFLQQTTIAEQQAKVEELQTHASEIHKREIKLFEKTLILTHERDELQKRVDLAILGINGVMRWIDEDAIDDADFIRGGVLSALRRLEQALKGEGQ